jgi:hypothetical protein
MSLTATGGVTGGVTGAASLLFLQRLPLQTIKKKRAGRQLFFSYGAYLNRQPKFVN